MITSAAIVALTPVLLADAASTSFCSSFPVLLASLTIVFLRLFGG